MEDNKTNFSSNQSRQSNDKSVDNLPDIPQTIFESTSAVSQTQPIQPEEAPDEMTTSPPPELPPQEPQQFIHSEKSKYIFIGLAIVFFVIILAIAFSIMSGVFSRPKKAVKLVWWGLWEDKEIFQPLIDQYNDKNKHVTIEYVKMTPQDYREKLLARGKEGKGPDMFRFHNTWLPEIGETVSPLPSSVMPNAEFKKTFYPIHQKDLEIGDKYYGIPLMIDGLILTYNQTLFSNVGINKPPANWEDILDYLGKLTVKDTSGQIVTAAIALGTASNTDHFSDIFGLFLLQNGGSIAELDQPVAASALESYRKFAEAKDSYWDESMPSSTNAFIQEKVAMIIVPSWQIPIIKVANPDLQLKTAPVPALPGSKPLSIATYWVEGVSRYSQNQVEAWKFLKFMSEKDSQAKLFELQSKTRLFGSAYSRTDMGSLLADNEYLHAVIKQSDAYRSIPTISRTYDNGLNDEINKYIENAINQTILGVTYDQALQTAKEGTDQVLNKFQIKLNTK